MGEQYLGEARLHFWRALYESEALGHHRNVGSVENNIGFLFLSLGLYQDAEEHLLRSRRIFETLSDSVRGAQLYDTLARLYLETKQFSLAQKVINQAVETLELTDSEAILSEALTTKGIVECRRGHYSEAKSSFEAAYKVSQRCGDLQGAARALLALLEEARNELDYKEVVAIAEQAKRLLSSLPQSPLNAKMARLMKEIIGLREQSD
jgi:tetratricopeptide (TPR) repeat protein